MQKVKTAVVGSGISGLTAAYLLSKHHNHDVTVFEKQERLGGHTATKQVTFNSEVYAIDTGFIVFNDWTYPNFIRLMNEIGVRSKATTMGFSVKENKADYEYAGNSLLALFAKKTSFFSLKHWQMLRDIVRFNRNVLAALETKSLNPEMTLGEYLFKEKYSQAFIERYLIPMGSAIWSSSTDDMYHFPLVFFARFFKNHGLLNIKNRPQWRVIEGGSSQYIKPLSQPFADNIVLNSNIKKVTRKAEKVIIEFTDKDPQYFDQVIFACHSDEALAVLADPSKKESEILGDITYKDNEVVLHTDDTLLPKRKIAWSSWNYHLFDEGNRPPALTYNMNILQGIKSDTTFCVTLNATQSIKPEKIIDIFHYSHPMFTQKSLAAQNRWPEINGVNNTWFCGAYWANGFHEDGCSSALRVARSLGVKW